MCNFLKLLFFNILGNNLFGIYILNVIKFTEKNGIYEIFNKNIFVQIYKILKVNACTLKMKDKM